MTKLTLGERFTVIAFLILVIVAVVLLGGTILHLAFGPRVALYCPGDGDCFGYAFTRFWVGFFAALGAALVAADSDTIKGLK